MHFCAIPLCVINSLSEEDDLILALDDQNLANILFIKCLHFLFPIKSSTLNVPTSVQTFPVDKLQYFICDPVKVGKNKLPNTLANLSFILLK